MKKRYTEEQIIKAIKQYNVRSLMTVMSVPLFRPPVSLHKVVNRS